MRLKWFLYLQISLLNASILLYSILFSYSSDRVCLYVVTATIRSDSTSLPLSLLLCSLFFSVLFAYLYKLFCCAPIYFSAVKVIMTLILIVVVVNLTFDMTGRYERLNIPSKQLFNILFSPHRPDPP